MYEKIKSLIPLKLLNYLINIKNLYFGGFCQKSYSQEGEDRILQRIFEGKTDGFYVDVGAHHPLRFSNTYIFYKMGWRGINIDAMPGSMKLFNKLRPRDINIEQPISDTEEVLTYYSFNEPALNGFSKELSDKRHFESNLLHVINEIPLRTKRLETIIDENLPQNSSIDFLSVDVEGLDLQVLKSNNWDKYRPQYLIVEIISNNLADVLYSETDEYLRNIGYELFAKSVLSAIYRKNEQ